MPPIPLRIRPFVSVRFSVLGQDAEIRTALRGLESARGYIQTLLSDRCHFRNTPVLKFVADESIRKSMEMDSLIRRVREEDQRTAEERARRAVHEVDGEEVDLEEVDGDEVGPASEPAPGGG